MGNIFTTIYCIHDSPQFVMQHEYVLKNFDLLTPSPGLGVGGGTCMQSICYHIAAYVILVNLIFNMTMF